MLDGFVVVFEANQRVATLVVSTPDGEALEAPLVAGASVERSGPIGRLFGSLKFMLLGHP